MEHKIFMKNIPKDISDSDLEGRIKGHFPCSVTIYRNSNGKSLGCGILSTSEKEWYDYALKCGKITLLGTEVSITFHEFKAPLKKQKPQLLCKRCSNIIAKLLETSTKRKPERFCRKCRSKLIAYIF